MSSCLRLPTIGVLACTVFAACITRVGDIAGTDPGSIPRDRVLLLGRVHVILHGVDRTEAVAIETSAKSAGGYQLDRDGLVAWVTQRTREELRLSWVSANDDVLSLETEGPLLVPAGVDEAIIYFGTVTLTAGQSSAQRSGTDAVGIGPANVVYSVTDEAEGTLSAVVRVNPSLVGKRYYHVLRRSVFTIGRPAPIQARLESRSASDRRRPALRAAVQ